MNEKILAITLGHNSSAVFIEYINGLGRVLCGYEEERLSHIKSDSDFPIRAINTCLSYVKPEKIDKICISWWNDFSEDSNYHEAKFSDKHYDYCYISAICKTYGAELHLLKDNSLTHHDAHAYGALNFFETNIKKYPQYAEDDAHVLVMDGFGNNEEVFSIYKKTGSSKSLTLIHRARGYGKSLALMYQYATDFVGMKMNEDEYKFLGYESHIKDILTDNGITNLASFAKGMATNLFKLTIEETYTEEKLYNVEAYKHYVNVAKLNDVKKDWHNVFYNTLALFEGYMVPMDEDSSADTENSAKYLTPLGIKSNSFEARVIIGFLIQNVIEQFVAQVIKHYNINNLIVSGGIFYNVKFNNFILRNIPGYFCVYPLAGDQGAGIGMVRAITGETIKYNTLCWGLRYEGVDSYSIEDSIKKIIDENPELTSEMKKQIKNNIIYAPITDELINTVTSHLKHNDIVNIIAGNMEFGPRALCNTTTLALPTKENVAYINKLNARNDVMPMAPVIKEESFKKYFDETLYNRVIGSLHYMILTTDHIVPIDKKYSGITHKYPTTDQYSSRCQVVGKRNPVWVSAVLDNMQDTGHDFLINTSFNYHGMPICYRVEDALTHFVWQQANDKENRNYLIIGL